MILSHAQAKAVYRAMCELNNVGGKFDHVLFNDNVRFNCYAWGGGYGISKNNRTVEAYETQDAFAVAYGVQS